MNFLYWANVDGKLSLDFGGHTATLVRRGEKHWSAHVVIRQQRPGGGSFKKLRDYDNAFKTRREAAAWAAKEIGLTVPVNLMTFAMLPAGGTH